MMKTKKSKGAKRNPYAKALGDGPYKAKVVPSKKKKDSHGNKATLRRGEY